MKKAIALFILSAALLAGCTKEKSQQSGAASDIDPRMLGTWNDTLDGSLLIKISSNKSVAYSYTLGGIPFRIGTWKHVSGNQVEFLLDWLEDAKRMPDKAEEIRAMVNNEPNERFTRLLYKVHLLNGDLMHLISESGYSEEWRRVGK